MGTVVGLPKVTPPRVDACLPRPRLQEVLAAADTARLALVCAPAGFGKTTLLAAWAAGRRGPTAWVALEEHHDDPRQLVETLAAALRAADPELEIPPVPEDGSVTPWLQAACAALAERAPAYDGGLAVVLDDCHVLGRPEVADCLAVLLDRLPVGVFLVVASRAEPPLPVARLRARGQLCEVRAADLRFTGEEAELLLNHRWQLGLPARAVTSLATKTEGWAAGLYLAALSLRGNADPLAFIARFGGTHRHVLDYLVDEVLRREAAPVQDFLLSTSLLVRLSGPLCDALTGRTDGQETLEDLESRGLFLEPLDLERRWFRYHRLFADVLQRRLERSALDRAGLHRAAARWLEAHALAAEAVPHALAARTWDEAAALIERVAERVMQKGRESTFARWLDELPEQSLEEHPILLVYRDVALGVAHAGAAGGLAEPLMAGAEAAAHAISEYQAGRLAACVPHAEQALAALPEDRAWLRGTIALLLATIRMHSGEFEEAQAALEMLALRARAAANLPTTVACLRRLCTIEMACGRPGAAHARCEEALGLAFEAGAGLSVPAALWFIVAEARAALLAGAVGECESLLARADELAAHEHGPPADLLEARAVLCIARGDSARALTLGRQAALLAPVSGWLDPPDPRGAESRRQLIALLAGDLEAARGRARRAGTASMAPVEPSAFEGPAYLAAVRDAELAARMKLLEGSSGEAAQLAAIVADAAASHLQCTAEVSARVLEARALDAAGRPAEARVAVDRALACGEPMGLIGPFLLEGEPMARLLYAACREGAHAGFAGRALGAFPAREASRACAEMPDRMVEPLSGREIEILRLLAEGLSNKEIADQLFVSEKTVKWHATNIYGKLGVLRRTQAIARARALGILPRDASAERR